MRRFLACFVLTALTAIVTPSARGSSAESAETRPNIVLIMADDLGFSDLGCYGSEIETPRLDKLAQGGLRFSQFYNTAKCHSSRICLLTGQYMYQAGNQSMRHAVTLPEALKSAGYDTIMTGKWHLNGEPTDRGFDRYFGHLSGATNFFTGDNTFRLNGEKWNDFDKDFYTTDANTTFAIRFLEETKASKKPFFLYVAYNAPHYPLQAPKENVMKYRGKYREGWGKLRRTRYAKQKTLGLFPRDYPLSPRPDHVPAWESLEEEEKDWEDFRMATYAGMIDRLDAQIGRLVDYLEKRGELDNTLFMFCSDNGACPFERTRGSKLDPWNPKSYWTYDSAWAHAGNTPFRWYKQNQHEGGISSPFIVHWPRGLKTTPGSVTQQPGHLVDFMATLIDIAGVEHPKTFQGRAIKPLMGKSLLPIFRGETRKPNDWLYFQFSNNRAIRRGDWKLVSARNGPWELYDIAKDRTELENLAAAKPKLVEELSQLWHRVAKDVENTPAKNRKGVGAKPQPWKDGRHPTRNTPSAVEARRRVQKKKS